MPLRKWRFLTRSLWMGYTAGIIASWIFRAVCHPSRRYFYLQIYTYCISAPKVFLSFFWLSLTFSGGQITRLLIALIQIAFFAYISLLFILVYILHLLSIYLCYFFCLWYVRIFFSSSPYILLFQPVYPSLPARISLLLCLYVFPHCLSLYLFVFLSIYEFTLKSRQADLWLILYLFNTKLFFDIL